MNTDLYRRPHQSQSLGLVAEWMYALSERADLSDVLKQLMQLVRADAAMIARTSVAEHTSKCIARCDVDAGKVWPSQTQSYADALLGETLPRAKTGSVWKLSDAVLSGNEALALTQDACTEDLIEVVVCPLEADSGHADTLELHYRHQPSQHDLDLITLMVETLTLGWRRRSPGMVSKCLTRKPKYRTIQTDESDDIPILGIENPAHLSRCEFRVCTLLKEGMTVKLIAQALSIGPATVRSHLSSIFAKTDTHNQVELLHKLNRQARPENKVVNG